ncbi:MAG: glycosyltransferase family 4 protein [Pseudomonadota bacterium]|jgi:glycosyltransferase involved in cell wall biosynthesis
MRILALPTSLDRPEAALFAGLAKRGASVTVMGRPTPEHRQTLDQSGIKTIEFEFKSRFDLRGMRDLRRIVREHQIDIVYALSNRALSSAVIGLYRIPVRLVAYRGTVGHISWYDPSSWFTYLNSRVSRILCVSQAVERYLAKIGIPQQRLITIYKGHDPAWYHTESIPSRAEFSIPADAFVVGCTAVMRAVKGVDDLIAAVRLLVKEIPTLHLLLIGTIKDRDIERAVADFPEPSRIHTTGFRTDATRLARLADITVMASKSREGFPKSVIEAMSQGVPALVTAVGGMPELVGYGNAGILARPNDPESIADGIRALYHDRELRSRLGRAGAERIGTIFHIEKTIDKTYEVFSELLCSQT